MAEMEQQPVSTGMPSPLRVSHQPIMVAGLTGSEFLMAISAGFIVFLFICVVSLPVLGAIHFSLLVGSVTGVAAAMGLRASIVRVKRQRPEGYPLQLVHHVRHDIEPIPGLVAAEGLWDPLRHAQMRPAKSIR